MLGFGKSKMAAQIVQTISDHKNQLYRIAYAYTKSEQDALDVIQEMCVKAISKQDQLKESQYIKTWLIKILIREAMDLNRKKGRSLETFEAEMEVISEETPEGIVIEEESHEQLYIAIEKLPPISQEIIKLRYFEEFKLEEIAEITTLPLSTVKTRLYKALSSLKSDLKGGVKYE